MIEIGTWAGRLLAVAVLLVLIPVLIRLAVVWAEDRPDHWSRARTDSVGLAPDPAATPEAVIQVYVARTWGWKGVVAVHSWVVAKPSGAPSYSRYEVVGWGVGSGASAVRVSGRTPDGHWAGSAPTLVAERRGDGVDAMIVRLRDAVASYPHALEYRSWPGPNSNTFVAHLLRALPELEAALPSTAIGKDFLPGGAVAARTPSGTGVQLSIFGLLGILVGLREGVELDLLGFTIGVDFLRPALKLPAIGRIGLPADAW